MKKINVLFFAIAIAISTFIVTGCGDEIDPPTISVTQTATDAWRGDTVTFTVTMGTNEKLENLNISPTAIGGTGTDLTGDVSISGTSYEHTFNYVISNSMNDGDGIDITFTVTQDSKENDKNSKTASISVVNPAGGAITTYTGKILGAQNSTSGSFFASSNGDTYTVSAAFTNQSLIDFIYYYGATNYATLAAPDDSDVAVFSVFNLANWTTKNSTKFKSTTGITWASVTDDNPIVTAADGASATAALDLSANDIIAFVTEAGKKGLFKVNTITTGDTGTINIDVKVQQ